MLDLLPPFETARRELAPVRDPAQTPIARHTADEFLSVLKESSTKACLYTHQAMFESSSKRALEVLDSSSHFPTDYQSGLLPSC